MENNFKHVTTEAVVETYKASVPIFLTLLAEVKVLSRKKPEATMSAGKVSIINKVLTDLYEFLKKEPTGKYLALLDDKVLPQVSDAVLAMVQFETAIKAFNSRYHMQVERGGAYYWITEERLKAWAEAEQNKEDSEDEDDDDWEDDSEEDDSEEDDEQDEDD